MRILISGGSGFLGRALTRRLTERGDQVAVLSRSPSAARVLARVETYAWDARTTAGWGHLMEQVDVVINLAGENIGASRWTPQRMRAIHDSRTQAGQALTTAVREAGRKPLLLLQASGVGYYGIAGRDREIDETARPGNDRLARISIDWEDSTAGVEELGVRRAVTRSGVVLAAHIGILPRQELPFRLFAGGPLGTGRQWISWIHKADYIEAVLFLLDHEGARGVFNVTSPQPVTNADFGRALGRALHRPYWAPAPGFILRWVLGEMSMLVLEGQRVVPRRLQALGFRFQYPSIQAALSEIYSPAGH